MATDESGEQRVLRKHLALRMRDKNRKEATPMYDKEYDIKPTPDMYEWALSESVRVTLVGNMPRIQSFLVERMTPSDVVLERPRPVGFILTFAEDVEGSPVVLINGQYVDLGDDMIEFTSIADDAWDAWEKGQGDDTPVGLGASWISHPFEEEEEEEYPDAPYADSDMDPERDSPDELLAAWATTQPADNIVYLMSCGHEYDSAIELLPGTAVPCSQHGLQKIASEFDGPKEVTNKNEDGM